MKFALVTFGLLAALAAGCGDQIEPTAVDFVFRDDLLGQDTFTVGGAPVRVLMSAEDIRAVDTSGNSLVILRLRESVDFSQHGDVDVATCLDINTTSSPPYGRQAGLLFDGADDSAIVQAKTATSGLPKRSVTVCHAP